MGLEGHVYELFILPLLSDNIYSYFHWLSLFLDFNISLDNDFSFTFTFLASFHQFRKFWLVLHFYGASINLNMLYCYGWDIEDKTGSMFSDV